MGYGNLESRRVTDGGKYRATDQFGDLGNYGVSAATSSVQPIGNPINHSCRHGFVREGMYVPRRRAAFRELLPPAFEIPFLRGVGKKGREPKSISDMGGAKVGRVDAIPNCMIPDLGQVTEDSPKPASVIAGKQFWDVFHDCDLRSKFANKARELSPKARPLAINARSLASLGQVLAGKTATDNIDSDSIRSQPCSGKLSHVMVAGDAWPVLGEDAAGEFFDFTERDRFEAASSFEAKAKSSDTAEKVQHLELGESRRRAMAGGVASTRRRSVPLQAGACWGAGHLDALRIFKGSDLAASARKNDLDHLDCVPVRTALDDVVQFLNFLNVVVNIDQTIVRTIIHRGMPTRHICPVDAHATHPRLSFAAFLSSKRRNWRK